MNNEYLSCKYSLLTNKKSWNICHVNIDLNGICHVNDDFWHVNEYF